MKNIKKRFAIAVGVILATFLLPFEVALAAPANEMGCILRQPGSMKFVKGDQLDRQTIAEAVSAQRLQGAKVIDPCLTGQVRNIPASVYTKLAEKHPEKFQPLEGSDQSISQQAVLFEKAMNQSFLKAEFADVNKMINSPLRIIKISNNKQT